MNAACEETENEPPASDEPCDDCGGREQHTGDCGQWRKDIDAMLILSALCPGSLTRLFSMTSDVDTTT